MSKPESNVHWGDTAFGAGLGLACIAAAVLGSLVALSYVVLTNA